MMKLSVAFLLNTTEFFLSHTAPEAIRFGALHFSKPTILTEFPSISFRSRLLGL